MRRGKAWVVRVAALIAAGCFLAVALVIRAFTGDGHGSGAAAQISGTALYASMVYAGVLVLWPRIAPLRAGLAASVFCWAVEAAQLTGVPATLSAHSLLARVVLGVKFDWNDMLWYPAGVIPLVIIDVILARPPQLAGPTPGAELTGQSHAHGGHSDGPFGR